MASDAAGTVVTFCVRFRSEAMVGLTVNLGFGWCVADWVGGCGGGGGGSRGADG